jgi:hypothetical protein
MKKKYRGFLSVGFISLALGLTAAYAVGGSHKADGGVRLRPLKPLPARAAPNPETLKEINQLELLLDSLASSPESAAHTVDLSAFGYEPSENAALNVAMTDTAPSVRMDYTLTFAFSSNTKRFCIIDGKFLSEGDTLSDGGTIVEIEPYRVLVRKQNFESWLYPDRP